MRCDAETRLADVTERLQHELDEAAARIDVLERIVAAEKVGVTFVLDCKAGVLG